MRLLYPRLSLHQFAWMLLFGLVGALIAGAYGILHDQITMRLGVEYFSRFKLEQFHYLDASAPLHLNVMKIGFLATWWVGLFAGWFMGRVTLPHEPVKVAARRCAIGVGLMIMVAVIFAVGASIWAPTQLEDARIGNWSDMLSFYHIQDPLAFIRVGYIHNASYLGGLVGLISVLAWLRITRKPSPKIPARLPLS
ncbi:hypothetical protein WJU23_07665 [Prosthecobacter sp. SYSU 5D2]|uniref:hypothetical protein n=1 Tax=Prosthecobacter sp. SYSU 5D2 TaxID=3134134 RepID=UPI0031FF22E8